MSAPLISRAAIVGVGLIGGSLGMALRARRLAKTVTGIELSSKKLELALRLGAVDCGTTNPAEGVADADLIVLAVPVGQIIPALAALAPHLKPGAVVTDVGSVKAAIVKRAEEILPPANPFVGGHPMTGSEQKGVENADPYLFENACYVLTRTPRTDTEALNLLEGLAGALGARCLVLTPEEHDCMVAGVSHLPHVAAAALVNAVGGRLDPAKVAATAGGGFRDSTRVAAGDPRLWVDILLLNREKLTGFLQELKSQLSYVESAVAAGDKEALAGWLERAADLRKTLPFKFKGHRLPLHNIVVDIPDRPGSIARVASLLAGAGINIADLEIVRVREKYGGTVRFSFASPQECDAALEVLRAGGVKSRLL